MWWQDTLRKAGGKRSFAFSGVSLSVQTEPVLTERNGLHLNCSGSSSHLGSEVEGGAGGGKWVARENNIYS